MRELRQENTGSRSRCKACDVAIDLAKKLELRDAIDEVYAKTSVDEEHEFVCPGCLKVKSKFADTGLIRRKGKTPRFTTRYSAPKCNDCFKEFI